MRFILSTLSLQNCKRILWDSKRKRDTGPGLWIITTDSRLEDFKQFLQSKILSQKWQVVRQDGTRVWLIMMPYQLLKRPSMETTSLMLHSMLNMRRWSWLTGISRSIGMARDAIQVWSIPRVLVCFQLGSWDQPTYCSWSTCSLEFQSAQIFSWKLLRISLQLPPFRSSMIPLQSRKCSLKCQCGTQQWLTWPSWPLDPPLLRSFFQLLRLARILETLLENSDHQQLLDLLHSICLLSVECLFMLLAVEKIKEQLRWLMILVYSSLPAYPQSLHMFGFISVLQFTLQTRSPYLRQPGPWVSSSFFWSLLSLLTSITKKRKRMLNLPKRHTNSKLNKRNQLWEILQDLRVKLKCLQLPKTNQPRTCLNRKKNRSKNAMDSSLRQRMSLRSHLKISWLPSSQTPCSKDLLQEKLLLQVWLKNFCQ